MPCYDFRSPRLYLDAPMASGAMVPLSAAQRQYLLRVLRLAPGDTVLVFNGRDGEWLARISSAGKRSADLALVERSRPQSTATDVHYLFAPLKHARLDYMIQKAVEMGAARLQPVITRRTQAERVNLARMQANAVEAAEQCGILTLPEIAPPIALERLIADFGPERLLIFCDEDAEVKDPIAALAQAGMAKPAVPLAVLIGPEGGFDPAERALLMRLPRVLRLALGPRILRADTAAVAALALTQAVLGDWR
jgi:16S rRNA (uracil1498-N3)-methyltransferase